MKLLPKALSRLKKIFAWMGGTAVVVGVLVAFALPPVVRGQLEARLGEALHRPVSVAEVAINPLSPSLTVRGLQVKERSGDGEFVAFDELYVNLAWSSLLKRAPVVDEVRLVKPRVRVSRGTDKAWSFQDLLKPEPASPVPPPAVPEREAPAPKFAVFNIQLLEGRVEFEDLAEQEKHELTELRVGIPFLSSLPADVEVKVAPELSAKVNGAQLALKGETRPFSGTRVTTLNVDLDAFDLTRLVDYAGVELRAKLESAKLDTRLVVAFEQPEEKTPLVTVSGKLGLRDVSVLDAAGAPVVAWSSLGVELTRVDALAPSADVKAVVLEGLKLHVDRDAEGRTNLARLQGESAKGKDEEKAAEPEKEKAAPVSWKVGEVLLKGGQAWYRDGAVKPEFATEVQALEISVRGLDSKPGSRFEAALGFRTDAAETVQVTAEVTDGAEGMRAAGKVNLGGVLLPRYQPYVDGQANLVLDQGTLSLGSGYAWQAGAGEGPSKTEVKELELGISGFRARLPGEKEPLLRWDLLSLEDVSADTVERAAKLGQVTVEGLAVSARRERDRRMNFKRISRLDPNAPKTSSEPWRVELGALQIVRGDVVFDDRAVPDPVRLRFPNLEMKATGLSTVQGPKGTLEFKSGVDRGGTVALAGPFSLEPLAGELKLDARKLNLVPFQRYLDEEVTFVLTSGALGARGLVQFEVPDVGATRAAYRGEVSINEFASVDKEKRQDLLKWKTLSVKGIDYVKAPRKVMVGEVALADFYARTVLSSEGKVNLAELFGPSEDAPADPKPAETPAAAASPEPPSKTRIGKITFTGGNVHFSDFFIKPNYAANLVGVSGLVTEMTPERPGDVELRAKMDGTAPVDVLGRVNALSKERFVDLDAKARDIELAPMSPYMIKYAGYGIERGKLSVKLKYLVENRKLMAENNFYLDQFTFGDKVESPTATKLPVKLAVALLKDQNGVIDVDLPLTGSLDDPEFSVFGLVLKVVGNLVVKAVTAPFALLGAAFGGGEELAFLEFGAGSAVVDAAGMTKLQTLAKALKGRPGLRLDVAGRVDPAVDREGLAKRALAGLVRGQKFDELLRAHEAPGSADEVVVAPAEYGKYLKLAYAAELVKRPRPAVKGEKKEPTQGEMEGYLLAGIQITEEDLRVLANARSQAAKEWLVGNGGIAPERIFILAPKLHAEGIKDGGRPSRVEFSLK